MSSHRCLRWRRNFGQLAKVGSTVSKKTDFMTGKRKRPGVQTVGASQNPLAPGDRHAGPIVTDRGGSAEPRSTLSEVTGLGGQSDYDFARLANRHGSVSPA